MISLERLYKALQKSNAKCSFFIIGFTDSDFGKKDNDVFWYFTMNQWLDGRSLNSDYRKIAWYDEKFKKWNVNTKDIRRTTLREFRWLLEKTFETFEK